MVNNDKIEFFDPHFHIWDINEEGIHDPKILFEVKGQKKYGIENYINDVKTNLVKYVGGVFVEAMSPCFKSLNIVQHTSKCLEEFNFFQQQCKDQKEYKFFYVSSANLDIDQQQNETLIEHFQKLKQETLVKGIRQILNFNPNWPRNYEDLLLNQQWRVPTIKDLENESSEYWSQMEQFSKISNVFIKISALCYIDDQWDQNEKFIGYVQKVIEIIGFDRSMFATNFPVDLNKGWDIEKLINGFLKISQKYDKQTQQKLFQQNALKAYNIKKE